MIWWFIFTFSYPPIRIPLDSVSPGSYVLALFMALAFLYFVGIFACWIVYFCKFVKKRRQEEYVYVVRGPSRPWLEDAVKCWDAFAWMPSQLSVILGWHDSSIHLIIVYCKNLEFLDVVQTHYDPLIPYRGVRLGSYGIRDRIFLLSVSFWFKEGLDWRLPLLHCLIAPSYWYLPIRPNLLGNTLQLS